MSVEFLKGCIKEGLAHSYDVKQKEWLKPYPEVTGYVLSYFSSRGLEYNLCQSMAYKLIESQKKDGGWATFNGNHTYFFDTVQICHGLIDYYIESLDQMAVDPIIKGLKYLESKITFGKVLSSSYKIKSLPGAQKIFGWGHGDTAINSKVFEIEKKAKKILNSFSLSKVSRWMLANKQIEFTHPGGYQLEGILAAGNVEIVKSRLDRYFTSRVNDKGQINYNENLNYEYNSGSVQIGILAFKVGYYELAELICDCNLQKKNKTFLNGLPQYSSTCENAILPHHELNCWGSKYLLELEELLGWRNQ